MDEQEGNWKSAELNYRRALEIDPYFASVYNNWGVFMSDRANGRKLKNIFWVHDFKSSSA